MRKNNVILIILLLFSIVSSSAFSANLFIPPNNFLVQQAIGQQLDSDVASIFKKMKDLQEPNQKWNKTFSNEQEQSKEPLQPEKVKIPSVDDNSLLEGPEPVKIPGTEDNSVFESSIQQQNLPDQLAKIQEQKPSSDIPEINSPLQLADQLSKIQQESSSPNPVPDASQYEQDQPSPNTVQSPFSQFDPSSPNIVRSPLTPLEQQQPSSPDPVT